jgi:hypothetical protein
METKINYYTIKEIESGSSNFMPIPKRTQARYRKEGLLPFFRIGRQIYYKNEHLEYLFSKLEQHTVFKKAD